MSTHISLSRDSATTAYAELSIAIHIAKERIAAATDAEDKAFYEAELPAITAARDELASQLWHSSGKKAAA